MQRLNVVGACRKQQQQQMRRQAMCGMKHSRVSTCHRMTCRCMLQEHCCCKGAQCCTLACLPEPDMN
jgi:hypothetical protein